MPSIGESLKEFNRSGASDQSGGGWLVSTLLATPCLSPARNAEDAQVLVEREVGVPASNKGVE